MNNTPLQLILPTYRDIKAARHFLEWDQRTLAEKARVSVGALTNIENRKNAPSKKVLEKIAKIYWNEGIHFLPEGGFRAAQKLLKIYEGYENFKEFFDDVYATAQSESGEFLCNGVNENNFLEAHRRSGLDNNKHRRRMAQTSIRYRVLISDQDINTSAASYVDYRILENSYFHANVPFYIYGKKLAIILWKDTPKIIVIHDSEIVKAYKKQFEFLWKNAKIS